MKNVKVKTIRDDAKGMFARVGWHHSILPWITQLLHELDNPRELNRSLKQLEYNINHKVAEKTDKRIIRVIRKGRIL